jgi:hypothetical protein
MALRKRGKWWYGESQADIRDELVRVGKLNEYVPTHFADAQCVCGGRMFRLLLDEGTAAVRVCAKTSCAQSHPIGDSDEYLDEAELEECACACGGEEFEITVGVHLYADSEDVKWVYIGCRCVACGLTANYGDWKNEFEGYQAYLARV